MMKLSEIRGPRCIDVVADLLCPLGAIAADPEAKAAFAGDREAVAAALPGLMKSHREELLRILTILSGREDYGENLTLPGLMRDLTDLAGDRDFLELFT